VSDKCKIKFVPHGNHNKPGLTFVGLGASVTYYCPDDYHMIGYETLVCHPYGWDRDPPVCERELLCMQVLLLT